MYNWENDTDMTQMTFIHTVSGEGSLGGKQPILFSHKSRVSEPGSFVACSAGDSTERSALLQQATGGFHRYLAKIQVSYYRTHTPHTPHTTHTHTHRSRQSNCKYCWHVHAKRSCTSYYCKGCHAPLCKRCFDKWHRWLESKHGKVGLGRGLLYVS